MSVNSLSRIPTVQENREVEQYFTKMKEITVFEDVPYEEIVTWSFGKEVDRLRNEKLPAPLALKAHARGGLHATLTASGATAVSCALGSVLIGGPIGVFLLGTVGAGLVFVPALASGLEKTEAEEKLLRADIISVRETAYGGSVPVVASIFKKISQGDENPMCSHFIRMAIATPCNHTFELWDLDQLMKREHERQFAEFRQSDSNYARDLAVVISEFSVKPTPCPVCRKGFLAKDLRIDQAYYTRMYSLYKRTVAQRRREELPPSLQQEREVKENACVIA